MKPSLVGYLNEYLTEEVLNKLKVTNEQHVKAVFRNVEWEQYAAVDQRKTQFVFDDLTGN